MNNKTNTERNYYLQQYKIQNFTTLQRTHNPLSVSDVILRTRGICINCFDVILRNYTNFFSGFRE